MSNVLMDKMRQGTPVYGPWIVTNSVDNVL